MDLKFILNEYILIWNLLFKRSLSKELNDKKQKIWMNYKKEYNELYNEKISILKDPINYIPTDDTIYNIIKEDEVYIDIYEYCTKYKLNLSKYWDINKKNIVSEIKEITKIDIGCYNILLIDPRFNFIEYLKNSDKQICYGKESTTLDTIIDIVYNILKKEILNIISDKEYIKTIDLVLELLIKNELKTRLTGKSNYYYDIKNNFIKKEIYPYLLIYLGIKLEDFDNFFRRDNVLFDSRFYDDFYYPEDLKNYNIYNFIKFCYNKINNNYYINNNLNIRIEEVI